jgi:hypothetical protein
LNNADFSMKTGILQGILPVDNVDKIRIFWGSVDSF